MKTPWVAIITVIGALLSACDHATAVPRVSLALLAEFEHRSTANVMITMRDRTGPVLAQANAKAEALTQANGPMSRGARIGELRTALVEHTQHSQEPVKGLIAKIATESTATGMVARSFWITNQIHVRNAPLSLVQLLANHSAISDIDLERVIRLDPPPLPSAPAQLDRANPEVAQWGVVMVRAPQVWESPDFSSNGTGVVVGIIDTGVSGTHEALQGNYLNDGHSWADPFDFSTFPRDGHGHGTHAAGSAVGQTQGIGVAPGAKWIACKGLSDEGSGSNAYLLACGEFMLCPTNPVGGDEDCARAPHVVSNSWGGGQGDEFYAEVIAAWHAAGIIPVFAIGNEGSKGCGSASSPGDQPDVISVGATTISDSLASFSSLGPSVDGARKPDISAPGQNIVSADASGDSKYKYDSGTSMAAPHVTGVVALLLSYKPTLKYGDIKHILESSADHDLTFTHDHHTCGWHPISTFPNNHFGYGRVNTQRALQLAKNTAARFAMASELAIMLLLASLLQHSFML